MCNLRRDSKLVYRKSVSFEYICYQFINNDGQRHSKLQPDSGRKDAAKTTPPPSTKTTEYQSCDQFI
jgi:hypothetical protein